MDIASIVLAGGKGLRLGRDKTLEKVNSKGLLQRVVSRLGSFSDEIIIVTHRDKSFPQLAGYPGFRVVVDAYPGSGALVGLGTGLAASKARYNLVVACDMPFLNQALLQYMLEQADGFDLAVPRLDGMVEPLHAVYSRSCLPHIEGLLKQGRMQINGLFELVKVRYLGADEIDRFDPKRLSFFNVNTEADLAEAQRLAREI